MNLKLALPTGRIQQNVYKLLDEAGIRISGGPRSYRPTLSAEGFDTKILKTQNIVEMLAIGRRDIGFAGHDWVREKRADVIHLLDTGFDKVRIVAAAPHGFPEAEAYQGRTLVIATEYVQLAQDWIDLKGMNAKVIRSYGTTEVFPPEDADCIVDNTSTGETLKASGLQIIDELMQSSTALFASQQAMANPELRARIEDFVLLIRSVLDARDRVMVEVNVSRDSLEAVAACLPSMRQPTVAALHGDAGFVVKSAVKRTDLVTLIPLIKAKGGTDIVVSAISNVIP